MSNELTQSDPLELMEREVALLKELPPLEPDDVLLLRGKAEEAARRLKQLRDGIDDVLLAWLKANGGKYESGEWRYVAAPDKSYKAKNIRDAVDATLQACGGDVDAFVSCLSANALKPGAVRKVLGDKFDDYFETVVGDKVKVQAINTKFIKDNR